MISVQYTSIRPINYPVNHETRILLLYTDVYVRVNSCSQLSDTIRSLLNCATVLYITGIVSLTNDWIVYVASRTACASCHVMYEIQTFIF